MKLTPQEIETAVIEWKRLNYKACALCTGKDVVIGGMVGMQSIDGENSIPGQILPLCPIVCRHCGNTLLISATALKLVQATEQPKLIP